MSKLTARHYQQINDYQKLLHMVFKQSAEGAKLLEIWCDHLLRSPEDLEGRDLFLLGKTAGRNDFVRDILDAIDQAEGEQ